LISFPRSAYFYGRAVNAIGDRALLGFNLYTI
jgi:hypothetical protein